MVTPALYGHPFSSYTWKALIALYANATPFEFRMVDPEHPEHASTVAVASPLGKFPLLVDEGREVFEATAIVEYLDVRHPGAMRFIPEGERGVDERMLDRVFDNYVMSPVQEIVSAHIRAPGMPDPATVGRAQEVLDRAYPWIDRWLGGRPPREGIGLVECAAAPSLFYADWVYPIPSDCDRLRQWRAHLLALPAIKRCVDEARPYRHFFPLGAPDRD
jgi:glutathione S-transferase